MSWSPPGPAVLFCPADRPERVAKAAARADAVVVDLEDGCRAERRAAARRGLAGLAWEARRMVVRVNPVDSPEHAADVAAVARVGCGAVMLPKAESGAQVEGVDAPVIALVETPRGVLRVEEVAAAANCVGLMWGAEDLVAGLGGDSSRFGDGRYRDVARHARSAVLLAAAAYGRFAVDAVFVDIDDHAGLRAEAEDAAALGFAATACIHPAQVPVVRAAYAPGAERVAWARRLLAEARQRSGVFAFEGRMVDAPLFRQAEAIARRADLAEETGP